MHSTVNQILANKEAKIGQQVKNLADQVKSLKKSKNKKEHKRVQSMFEGNKSKELLVYNTNKYRNQFGLQQEYDKYKKMILSPYNSPAVRGPSKFFQPTSLLTYRLEHDFVPSSTAGVCCVLPHCIFLQAAVNSFAFFNVNKDVVPGVTSNLSYTGSTVTSPNAVFVHPLAGGGNVAGTPSPVDQSSSTFTDSGKRYTTARVLALGIRVFSTGQNIARTGTLTFGILPGISQQYASGFIPIPSPQALRQYPTSYEVASNEIPSTGTDLIWLPLDPLDDTFTVGQARIGSDDTAQQSYYRNQMWVLFNGISSSDSFRIEVVTHVEYIPTLPFGSWCPPQAPNLDMSHLTEFLKSIRNNLGEVINGDLGRAVCGAFETGKKITQGLRLISAVV